MAYSFGAANSDRITVPALAVWNTDFVFAVRLRVAAVNSNQRGLWYGQGFFDFDSGANNLVRVGYQDSASNFPLVTWASGFAAGSLHTVVGRRVAAAQTLYIFADTDPTPKATGSALLGSNGSPAGSYSIGGDGATLSADSTIYEVAVWHDALINADQCAQFGAGYDASFLNPKPSYHWRLIGDPNDHIGGKVGTVTGATLVAHDARIFYPVSGRLRRFTTTPPPIGPSAPHIRADARDGWRGSWRGQHRGMA